MEIANDTARALRGFALVVAASAAAASVWAQTRPEPGLLLDARTWQEEVVAASTGPWAGDGWYRLEPHGTVVDVRAVQTSQAETVAADAVYVRLPGAGLREGARPAYRDAALLAQPRIGQDYELTLRGMRFSLRVDNGVKGMEYAIGYGGQAYTYVLGPFDATRTGVRAVADLDGDALPDFLVDVDDATYLLLSTRAQPGANLPTAEGVVEAVADGC